MKQAKKLLNDSFDHSKYRTIVSKDLFDAFHEFTNHYEIDVKYHVRSGSWCVTIQDSIVSFKHPSRKHAMRWVIENSALAKARRDGSYNE
ncbi:MAG: hypothetical protein MN733_31025 [Nitrososphaera sp.]|nr:hypothetical protein [Nitrososphaera sp.]